MSDLIERQVAKNAICNACGKIDCDQMDTCEKLKLPSVQPDLPIKEKCAFCPHCNNCDVNDDLSIQPCVDTISRKAAIDALEEIESEVADGNGYQYEKWRNYFCELPSAQPEKRTEERTETHACDLISRQAAIDAILAVTGNSSVRELYEHVQEHGLSEMWSGGVNAAIDVIIAVPSAQPDNQTNLCDSCNYSYPDCPSKNDDVIFGNGIGNDNICACNKYKPSAQPEQRLSCKNCIHLGHGYMMPCKNCKRNQMLPDWYEV